MAFARVAAGPSRRSFTERLRANVGAYRACYADAEYASARGSPGTRHFEVSFDRRGFVAAVTPHRRDFAATRSARGLSRGRPAQRLDRSCPSGASCGDDCASPVDRAGGRARDGFAARGPPETAAEIQAQARAALDAGDGESARSLYEQLAAKLSGDPRACDGRADALAATETPSPGSASERWPRAGRGRSGERRADGARDDSLLARARDLMRLARATRLPEWGAPTVRRGAARYAASSTSCPAPMPSSRSTSRDVVGRSDGASRAEYDEVRRESEPNGSGGGQDAPRWLAELSRRRPTAEPGPRAELIARR